LASLATNNANISIEPIFIKIATHNREMGDWIIRQLIAKEGSAANASLTGKLIICDKSMIAARLALLLESILMKIGEAASMPHRSTSQITFLASFCQFVSIYTRSLRYASVALPTTQAIDLATSSETLLKIITLLFEKRDDEM